VVHASTTDPKPVTVRDWSVRRHRPRPRAVGATRAAATGLAVVGLLSGAAATAGVFGVNTLANRAGAAESWDIPAQVSTALAAPPASVRAAVPTNLRIPAISVSTTLEPLGLEANGQLTPPAYTDAGWYDAGTRPGDVGPAVIAGHYDSKTKDTPSVFYRLDKLKVGDTIEVEGGGVWLSFAVTAVESFRQSAFPTALVYGPTPAAELRLITCGGVYSKATGSYSKNVVVFAVETTK
jgi:LPXTG-site transpeptidase (sortase) family protein